MTVFIFTIVMTAVTFSIIIISTTGTIITIIVTISIIIISIVIVVITSISAIVLILTIRPRELPLAAGALSFPKCSTSWRCTKENGLVCRVSGLGIRVWGFRN